MTIEARQIHCRMRRKYLARNGLAAMDPADLVTPASTLMMDLREERLDLTQGDQRTRNGQRVNQIENGGKIQIWVNQIEICKNHQESTQWKRNWFYKMRRFLT